MEILASILGGLAGGLFTFLGVLVTIRYEKTKDKKKEKQERIEKENELGKMKPRLEIQDYVAVRDFDETDTADVSCLLVTIKGYDKSAHLFYYDPLVLDKKNWCCVDYILKNTGGTEIDHLYLSTNLPQNTALLDATTDEYLIDYNNKFLNYAVILEKNIKPQQTVHIKICYITDQIIVSNLGNAPISIYLMDVNKNVWEQALFAPENKIYNSSRSSFQDFKSYTDVSEAIKCFDNPVLW